MNIKESIKSLAKNKAVKIAVTQELLPLIAIMLILLIFAGLASSILNLITFLHGTVQEGENSNVPYLVEQHIEDTEIIGRKITGKTTAKEIWNTIEENHGIIKEYLDNPEELQKMINAELCTSFLDLRENPNEPIDWKKLNSDIDSKEMQGIIKLKRARETGEYITMVYADPETFQSYIDEYNASGSEVAKNQALNHFTLEKGYCGEGLEGSSAGYGGTYTIGTGGQAKIIETDTATIIEIPQGQGYGTTYTYNSWQLIGAGNQKKLRDQAGMRFDEEGFGRINGRYAVATTPIFGNVGDYIDYYYIDKNGKEQVIPCIICDVKGGDADNIYGHHGGRNVIEFYVNEETWCTPNWASGVHPEYKDCGKASSMHVNPGTSGFHEEWMGSATKIVNGGSYFDNPDFVDSKIDDGLTTDENATSKKVTSTVKLASSEMFGQDDIFGQDTGSADEKMLWPTDSTYISSPFGHRKSPIEGGSENHGGIDIGYVATGDKIYAAESGVVIIAGNNGSAGLMVAIDHGNGYITKYMHNSRLNVKPGDIVEKGQVIAFAGSTGVSTGTHLHFQIEYNGKKINPLEFAYHDMNGEDVTPTGNLNGNSVGNGGIGYDINQAMNNYETGNYPSSSGEELQEGKYFAKIAIWEETTETLSSDDPNVTTYGPNTSYKMTTANINYEKIVKSYTMPFNFLWDFLLVGQQKEFVLELADLVFGSKVEISVLDCIRTSTNTSTYTYTAHVDVETDNINVNVQAVNKKTGSYVGGGTYGPFSGTDSFEVNYATTNTTVTKTNTIDVILSLADVWVVKYEQGYVTRTSTSSSSSNHPIDEDIVYDPTSDGEDPMGIAADYAADYELLFSGENTSVTSSTTQTSTYHRTDINRNMFVSNELYILQNLATPPNLEEKTDPDDSEPNFVNIFRKEEYYKNAQNIYSAPSWIFQMFEADERTADMIDLTKYLLYKATDKIYDGVDEFDWNWFYISNFKTVGGGWGSAGGGGGSYGNNFFASNGIEGPQGDVFNYLLARGIPYRGASVIVGNIEKQVNNGEITWEEAVENLDSMWKQIFEENPELFETLLNAKDEESMEYAAWLYAKFQGDLIENNFEASKDKIAEQLNNAIKWQTEFEEKNPASVIGDGSDVLGTCFMVAEEMLENGVVYSQNGLVYTDPEQNANYYVMKGQDCGGYVASVLYKSGIVTQEQWDYMKKEEFIAYHHPKNLINSLWRIGWDINVHVSEIQPGDVVSSGGHVVIYAGNNEYWDVYAGCVESTWRGGTRNDFNRFINQATDLHIARPSEANLNGEIHDPKYEK